MEYALQNVIISYDKIKLDIFEMLTMAMLEKFFKIFHQQFIPSLHEKNDL